MNLRLDNRQYVVYNFTQRNRFYIHGQIALLDFGHIQHVIEKPQ